MAGDTTCADATERTTGLTRAASPSAAASWSCCPTDTVYGIGADAFNADARRRAADGQGPGPGHAGAGARRLAAHPHGLVTDLAEPALRAGRRVLAGRAHPRRQAPAVAAVGPRRHRGHRRGPDAAAPGRHRAADRTGPMAVSSANLTGQPARDDVRRGARAARRLGLGLPRRRSDARRAVPSTIVDVTGEVPRCCCGRRHLRWTSCARSSRPRPRRLR